MGVTSGIAHLFQSIVEMIQGIFATILSTFKFALNAVVDVFRGFVNFVEGTLGFAIHNFFILGTVAAVVLGYMLYSQQQQQQHRKGTATAIKN
ncbi:hypothetical protein F5B22DRAFT_640723 [Xylaria bambusicola]|uniref:uncharacterized protein n=1 Tax=Xylaria bambusicola TaxID=326684 RepID=UPI002008C86A|nr:uncharacterized protein F5B22DRAFT_640723 [Xylaria bambusicola]KAI0527743.1 hypothetical protein F5B22DRAFT_640723 [Xylaria bambusicola]